MNWVTQLSLTGSFAICDAKFCIISRVGGRCLSESFLIYCTSDSSCSTLSFCWLADLVARDTWKALHLRANVVRLTPNRRAYLEYVKDSPRSSDLIAATAASIGLILVDCQRVEVWVVRAEVGLGRSLREHGRYAHGHSTRPEDKRKTSRYKHDIISSSLQLKVEAKFCFKHPSIGTATLYSSHPLLVLTLSCGSGYYTSAGYLDRRPSCLRHQYVAKTCL
jgi:hypothetical protein